MSCIIHKEIDIIVIYICNILQPIHFSDHIILCRILYHVYICLRDSQRLHKILFNRRSVVMGKLNV